MFNNQAFQNKKILLYGFGISGKSCFNYLKKNNDVEIFDDDETLKNKKNRVFFPGFTKVRKNSYDYIVVSPGINIENCKLKKYLKKNINKLITELDIFYLIFPKNIKITVTGTNGKSSTCHMLFKIFRSIGIDARLVGNIGNPPLKEKKIKPETVFIIEASSYQIFYSKYFKTDYAAILNLTTDHLERHGNINKYAKAKLKLIINQEKKNICFIEKNNKILNKNILKSKIKSKIFRIVFNREKFFRDKINNIYLLDKNNLKNIHFIYFICKKFKISDKIIFKSLNKYQGLKFRKQIIYYGKNLIIINDSKSTSFSSTVGLLSTYKNIYWIVGGKFKKGDRFILNKKYYKNIRAYLIGLDKRKFLYQLKNKIKFIYLKNLKRALMKIKKDIKTDNKLKTILFSPAAASFDQFKNFEQRGYFFNLQTKKLLLNE